MEFLRAPRTATCRRSQDLTPSPVRHPWVTLSCVLWMALSGACSAEPEPLECPVCEAPRGDEDASEGSERTQDAAPSTAPETSDWTTTPPADPTLEDVTTAAADSTSSTSDSDPGPVEAGTFGAPCTSNSDCFSGWCVEGSDGFICTQSCDEACPDGFDCKAVGGQSDVAFLCMPRLQKLCAPCTTDAQCNGGACLSLDGSTQCGYACSGDDDCPTGYLCGPHTDEVNGEGTWCQPATGSCTCSIDLNGGQRTCSAANEIGTCFGTQSCDQAIGWSQCTAQTPAEEICDGLDNDCDGLVDDDIESDQACENSNEFGLCTGAQTCVGGQGWVCDAAIPAAESCNFIDDDCDGALDEGFAAEDGTWTLLEHCGGCGNSCVGKFPNGQGFCDASEATPTCKIASCNEGFYMASDFHCAVPPDASCAPCTADADCFGGLCSELAGDSACVMPCDVEGDCLEGYTCSGPPDGDTYCLPNTGSCSCNAQNPGAKRTCVSENLFGSCYGIETCDGAAGWSGCTAPTPEAESCDGIDNDCDGLIDDALLDVGTPCENAVEGVGACAGVNVCQGNQGLICQAATPVEETCDFKDNDCDGDVDETFMTDGVYMDFDHCGTCYASCGLGFPNATSTACQLDNAGAAQCVVTECEEGYIQLNKFQCVPNATSLCQPCTTDQECLGEGAACIPLSDGTFCGTACADNSDCAIGYTCTDFGLASSQCAPETNACSCDGSNTDLAVTCSVTYTPPNPALPETICSGQQQCTADGWGACITPEEACDGIDNDCDGGLDETFKNAAGQYDTLAHCGACNISCFGVLAPNAIPTCSTAGFVPQCSYTCAGNFVDVDGLADNGCECQPVEGPDLAGDGQDTNCDGVDGDVAWAIFVAKNGDDDAPGTREAPLLTIQAALQAAYESGMRDVYVASGVYSENVTLQEGIGLFGGYSADFGARDSVVYETAILGQTPTLEQPAAVNADSLGLTNELDPTVLDGFSVFGANAANVAGANSYAIYLWSCGSGVEIRANRIFGGAGGNGAAGSSGSEGLDGFGGASGSGAEDVGAILDSGARTCTDGLDTNAGGQGGGLVCSDGTDVSGGNGGSSLCPEYGNGPKNDEQGFQGAGPLGGVGGDAGWDLQFDTAGQCGSCQLAPGNPNIEGLFGSPGAPGEDAIGGGGCGDISGTVIDGHWVGSWGGNSANGTHGSGGGGGGAGAGVGVSGNACPTVDAGSCCQANPTPGCSNASIQQCVCGLPGAAACCSIQWFSDCVAILEASNCGNCTDIGGMDLGGSGGGGGSGGCAGSGGIGGGAGGGSFGIFAAWADEAPSTPVIVGNTIRAGAGGQGGAGGTGGTGGQPGAGATGGTPASGSAQSWCATGGGEGGNGGRGGHGGGGGGGCGGASYGLFLWPIEAGAQADFKTDNVYLEGGQGGTGGAGGASLGSGGGEGATGAQGATNF